MIFLKEFSSDVYTLDEETSEEENHFLEPEVNGLSEDRDEDDDDDF